MERETYRYSFDSGVALQEVEESLLLAVLAAEGLHGRSRIHLEGAFRLDKTARTCVVDATTDLGRDIAQIFTQLLTREFGERAFRVERTGTGTGTAEKEPS
jgi:hypothetical protein